MAEFRPAKIVRIIARLNVGGPAKHVAWLTAGLPETEYQSLLVAGTVPDGEADMSYFADQLGVKPLFIPEMSREISFKDAITIFKLVKLFAREKPDIVHTHTAKAGTVGRVAGFIYRWCTPRGRQCKFVHTYHGHIFHSYYGRAKTRAFIAIEKLLARVITDRIVVVSEQQSSEICETFRVCPVSQVRVIPLGLDLRIFADHASRRERFRRELGVDDQTIVVGIVGRLTEIKNHELFLNAIARFLAPPVSSLPTSTATSSEEARGRQSHVRFVILGDGSLRENLERQAKVLGVSEHVVFAGARRDPEYFYPALDVVALTSRNEGTPLTLIEAMANSRAVVSTAVGGVVDLLGEVVEDGRYQVCKRGLRVDPGDEEGFAQALSRLVADAALREQLGRQGFEFVRTTYPKERLLDDIKNLYGELLNPEPHAIKARAHGESVHSRI